MISVLHKLGYIGIITLYVACSGYQKSSNSQLEEKTLSSCYSLLILPAAIQITGLDADKNELFVIQDSESELRNDIELSLLEALKDKYLEITIDSSKTNSTYFSQVIDALEGKSSKNPELINIPPALEEKLETSTFRYAAQWITEITTIDYSSEPRLFLQIDAFIMAEPISRTDVKNSCLLIDRKLNKVIHLRTKSSLIQDNSAFITNDFLRLIKPIYYKKNLDCE